MDFNATIDLIIKDLNEAREIIDDLKRYPGVPILQIELAKSKCRNAGEIISFLKNMKEELHSETPLENNVLKNEEANEQPVTEAFSKKEPSDTTSSVSGEKITFGNNEQEEKGDRLISEKEEEKEIDKVKESGSSIIADKFNNLSTRINEQMGSKKGKGDIDGVLKSKPITDLSDAIGINDRFMFIREIFDGNNGAYNEAISRLNKAASMEDANDVIKGYAGNRTGSDAVRQLLDLVKRKLPNDE
jgi:hypothetical protein